MAVLDRVDAQADALGWNREATRGYVVDYAYLYFRDERHEYDKQAARTILARKTLEDAEIWKRFTSLSRAVRGNESWQGPPTPQEAALNQFCQEVGPARIDELRHLALENIVDWPDDAIQHAIMRSSQCQAAAFHLWNLLAAGEAPHVLAFLGAQTFESPLAVVQSVGAALRERLILWIKDDLVSFPARWPNDGEFRQWLRTLG